MPCFASIYAELGIKQTDIGFWCSGSSDYLAGRAFSFISAIDSIGAVPPINESHVEMDAAWALYEAYIKMLTGQVDTALVYGFGKSSAGTLRRVLAHADRSVHRRPAAGRTPCRWPACRRGSGWTPASGPPSRWPRWHWTRCAASGRTDSEKPASSHRRAAGPAVLRGSVAPARHCADHRRRVGDRAGRRRQGPRASGAPGVDHRHRAPHRDAGARRPRPDHVAVDGRVGRAATGGDTGSIDVAEIYAPFTHQQLILTEAIGLNGVDEGQSVGWRAGRQPDVLRGPGAHRLRRPPHLRRVRRRGFWRTRPVVLRCNRIWSPSWKGRANGGAGKTGRRARHRADEVRRQAQGRLDERPRPRGDRQGARGLRARRSTTSTPSSSARRPTSSRAS